MTWDTVVGILTFVAILGIRLSTPHIGVRYAAIPSTVITARELKFSLVMNIV